MRNRYLKRAHFSERVFRDLAKNFALDIPALTSSKMLPVSRQCVQRVYSLLRDRIVELALEELKPFEGEIEVDESYFGARRVRGKRGRGASGKTPVLGLHKRGNQVFLSIVENCSKASLMPILRGNVLAESDVYTDGWKAYDGLVTSGYKHHRVHHHLNEFARGKNHVNGIESFWSFAKLRMAKLRGVGRDKFLLHLKECEWRWNHRKDNLYKKILFFCRNKPLQ